MYADSVMNSRVSGQCFHAIPIASLQSLFKRYSHISELLPELTFKEQLVKQQVIGSAYKKIKPLTNLPSNLLSCPKLEFKHSN